MPLPIRGAVECLWQLDATLGAAVASGSQPLTRQIRLAWWREALAGLVASGALGEPLLERVTRELLPCGLAGAELARIAEGWEHIAGSDPLSAGDRNSYAELRGGRLFRFSAMLLGTPNPRLEVAGQGWALVDLARHSSEFGESGPAMAEAAERLSRSDGRWPLRLRPIGMLVALARRDLRRGLDNVERSGAPGRMLRMFRHRLTGR